MTIHRFLKILNTWMTTKKNTKEISIEFKCNKSEIDKVIKDTVQFLISHIDERTFQNWLEKRTSTPEWINYGWNDRMSKQK
jgi:hypothetical protein